MLLCIGLSKSFTARPVAGCPSRSHAIARTSSLSLSAADDSLYASLRSRLAVSEGAARGATDCTIYRVRVNS